MSLLDEIVDLSVKDDEKVSVLLRKCLVLAAKIKNDKLKEWAQHELNGYPYPNPNSERLTACSISKRGAIS
jgi:AbiTii